MTRLCKLAEKYGADKGPSEHNYTPLYDLLFRDRAISRILEIGIDTGASLRMWEKYWPDAKVWGADINPSTLINEGNIRSILCNQGDENCLKDLVVHGFYDVIIDDGSHAPEHQLLSLKVLLPSLATGGLYIIEDVVESGKWGTLTEAAKLLGNNFTISMFETRPGYWHRVIVVERWW